MALRGTLVRPVFGVRFRCDGRRDVGRYGFGRGFESPVGIVTNILGAAFFFYLLATRDVTYTTNR